jgi:murein DD-endopeptidase MepM/ murein hydrolase activator NlpD
MLRLVVLAALLSTAAWLAREVSWINLPGVLASSNPHHAYLQSLQRSGIAETTLGRAWRDASARAIQSPQRTALPARHTAVFGSGSPHAAGFRVTLKRGQRVDVTATVEAATPTQAFVDVFSPDQDVPQHRGGGFRGIDYEAERDGDVIVRVQPELLRDGRLDISLRAAPSLRFPVANARARDLQSVFGDPRDAGNRRHEGVDIFATRGTPVVAATSGLVTRVNRTGIGGNVVWVWDPSRGLMFYYAHLDEQHVTAGTRVSSGDVLGTVGNTGNARSTAPHLHFGIYQRGSGAIDPYWFIAPPRSSSAASRR